MYCHTCSMIHMVDKTYPRRKRKYGRSNARCDWHAWDDDEVWLCECGKFVFAEVAAWCQKYKKIICIDCHDHEKVNAKFWLWKFYYEIECPFCKDSHPTLNRQEFLSEHPWQVDPFSCRDFPIWYPDGRMIEEKDVKEETEKKEEKKIACPHCKKSIRIAKPGTYRCPYCKRVFRV